MRFPQPPADISCIKHFLKVADDYEVRNVVISYYARMAAIDFALKCNPPGQPQPKEVQLYLTQIMEWLEQIRKEVKEDGIENPLVGKAIIEEQVLNFYNYAYDCDTKAILNMKTCKCYYLAFTLLEVLKTMGPIPDDLKEKCQVAKYRAAYINNMLKAGEEPTPINVTVLSRDDDESKYMISAEEAKKLREEEGLDPLAESNGTDPEKLRQMQEAAKKILERGNPEFQEELRKMKESVGIDDSADNDLNDDSETGSFNVKPVSPPPQPSKLATEQQKFLDPDMAELAQKRLKSAISALQYDDLKTAIEYIEKGLNICKFGKE